MHRGATVLAALLLSAAGWWFHTSGEEPLRSAGTLPAVAKDGSYQPGTLSTAGDEQAVAAAVDSLPLALSYDHRHLEDDLDKATARMTPEFASAFADVFAQTAAPRAREQKAVTTSLIRGAGLVRRTEDRALCLVLVDQVLIDTKAGNGSKRDKGKKAPVNVSQSRVLVALVEVDGTWLVDDITPI